MSKKSLTLADADLSVFGQPIMFNNTGNSMGGNAMLSQFLNIKKNYRTHLDTVTQGDDHATRYFCKDDCAYIFNVKVLQDLVAAILGDGPHPRDGVVVLFQGLKKDAPDNPNGKVPQSPPKKGSCWPFGRPTIIAASYYEDRTTGTLHHVKVSKQPALKGWRDSDGGADGYEHPGDGNGGTTLSLTEKPEMIAGQVVDQSQSPIVGVEPDGMSAIDFVIQPCFTVQEVVDHWLGRKTTSSPAKPNPTKPNRKKTNPKK